MRLSSLGQGVGIKIINLLVIFSFLFAPISSAFAQETGDAGSTSDSTATLTGTVGDTQSTISDDSGTVTQDSSDADTGLPSVFVPSETDTEVTDDPSTSAETDSSDLETEPVDGSGEPEALLSGGSNAPTTQAPNLFSYQSIAPQVDKNSGALTQKIKLDIPPGRKGLQPDVSLVYNSQRLQDDSIVGYGWSVSIPYIERMNKTGTNKLYTDNYFYSSVSGELATTSATTTPNIYYARVDDGSYIKYVFSTSTNSWIGYDKNGTQYQYGTTTAAQQYDTASTTQVYKWVLEEVRDTNGNYISYTYTKDVNQLYPSTITYTGNGVTAGPMTINFTLASSTVPNTTYKSGFKISTNKQISEISASVNGTWVRKYAISYGVGSNGFRPVLTSIQQTGRDSNGAQITLPAMSFSYASSTVDWVYDAGNRGYQLTNQAYLAVPSLNNGRNDQVEFRLNSTTGVKQGYINGNYIGVPPEVWADSGSPDTPREDGTRFFDVNGDGIPDVVRGNYKSGVGYTTRILLNTSTTTGTYNSWSEIATTSIQGTIPIFAYNSFTGGLLGNLNGDSITDYAQSLVDLGSNVSHYGNGQGWSSTSDFVPVKGMPNGFGANVSYNSQLVDVNGDGLDDWMWSDSNNTYFCLNQGTSWDGSCVSSWTLATSTLYDTVSAGYADRGMRFVDVNGDNLPDFIRGYNGDSIGGPYPGERGSAYQLFLNTGSGWATSTFNGLAAIATAGVTGTLSFNELADWDGDGLPDQYQSRNQASKQDVLTKITYPKGGNTQISYAMTSRNVTANPNLPAPLLTVTRLVTNDNNGHTTEYSYGAVGGKINVVNSNDRKFAGFSSITEIGPIANTVMYYNQGDTADTSIGERTDGYAQINRPFRQDVLSPASTTIKRTFYEWDSVDLGNNRFFVYLAHQMVQDFDATGSTHQDRAIEYTYSTTTGDLLQTTDLGAVSGSSDGTYSDIGSDTRIASSTYAQNTSINLSLPIKFTQATTSGSRIQETRYLYDSLPYGSVSKGNVTESADWISGVLFASTTKTYTTYGLVATSTNPLGHATFTSYDTYNFYPASVKNALNDTTTYAYDYAAGQVGTTTDPNGLVKRNIYDAVGRLIEQDQPDLTTPSTLVANKTLTYTDNVFPSYVKTTSYLSSATSSDAYEFFDGIGRTIQKRSQAGGTNTFTVQDTVYANTGLTDKTSLPYFASSTSYSAATSTAALFTTYTYDPLGRPLLVANAVGTTTYAYGPWKTFKTDPNGNTTEYDYDAQNNLTNVIEPITGVFPASGVVGYWKLDESSGNASDSSGYGNTLVNTGTTTYATGLINNAADFGTTSSSKMLAVGNDLGINGGSMTQSLWVKVRTEPNNGTNTSYGLARLSSEQTGSNHVVFYIFYEDVGGTKRLYFIRDTPGNPGNGVSFSYPVTLGTTAWHHIVLTSDGTMLRGYLDGVQIGTISFSGNGAGPGNSDDAFGLGGLGSGTSIDPSITASVYMDEVGVWNRALTVPEIKGLYNNGTGLTYSPASSLGQTIYTYDAVNNLTRITDSAGNLRNFTYDGMGRVLKSEDLHAPSATQFGSTTYAYDKAGNITTRINPNYQTTTYTYDALNRIFNENFTGATGTEGVYRYDNCTRGIGYICTASTTLSKLTYTYNPLGLVATETHLIASPMQVKSYVTTYSYDRQGNITEVVYPDGNDVKYGLDAMGRVQSITNKVPGGSVFSPIINNIEYAPTGQVSVRSYANGLSTFYTYDPASTYRLSNILTGTSTSSGLNAAAIQNINYSYDPVGNITQILDTSTTTASKLALFTYDELNRLIFASSTVYYPNSYVASSSLLNYVVVGGGGGGAGAGNSYTSHGGGGGGGQVTIGTTTIFTPTSYTVTVGPRGTRGAAGNNNGNAGGASVFGSFATSTGGAGGIHGTSGTSGGNGGASGSGNTGGTGVGGGAGGGGGASTAGQNGNGGSSVGGPGGTGTASSISGSNITYGSGGGGGGFFAGGAGGSGGGNGGFNSAGGAATANRGGGGGGASTPFGGTAAAGGHGGAGVVVISYPTGALTATGGATSTSGGKMIHTFTTSGTFTISAVNSTTTLYTYPELYKTSYTYNPIGNLTNKTDAVDGSNVSYTYAGTNYANPHAPTTVGSSTLAYDKNGNLTSNATSTYTWEWRDRMTQSVTDVGTTTYAYSTNDDRVLQTLVRPIGTTTATTTNLYTNKFYSSATTTIGVGTTTISNNATTTDYIFAGDTLIATIERVFVNGVATGTPVTRYYYPDHLGSTNLVTDTAGTLVETLDYYPYGAVRLNTQVGGVNANRQYIGQFTDPTNLSFLNARYYDSGRGQFLSQDPVFLGNPKQQNLMDPQTLNSYSYANGNPIVNKDPSGRAASYAQDAVSSVIDQKINSVKAQVQQAWQNIWIGAPRQSTTSFFDPVKGYNVLTNPNISTPERVGAGIGLVIGAASIPKDVAAVGTIGVKSVVEGTAASKGGVYALTDAAGKVMRTGRTNNLVTRQAAHARNVETKGLEFTPLFRTDDYATQRGLEQIVHDLYNAPLDKINGISPNNPNLQKYMEAANKFLTNPQ